jgi:hypothetical protein
MNDPLEITEAEAIEVARPRANETALAVIETYTPARLFEPGAIDPLIQRIKNEVKAKAAMLDISTDKNRKELASLAYQVGRSKTFIDKQRLTLVSDEKKRLKAIDAEGARIWDELESLQKEVRQPLTDWEEADKSRIAQLEADIAEIEGAGTYSQANWQILSVEAMRDRINEINSPYNWQEFTKRAEHAIRTSTDQITAAINQREKYDAEQAELAKLRAEAAERAEREAKEKAEREEKERAESYAQMLVKQAEEKAERARKDEADKVERERIRIENEKRDAEARALKAESDAKAAAEKAERDRIAAEAKAKQDQEAAIQRERERVANEEKRAADALAAREADKQHRGRINREILKSLNAAGFDDTTGKSIIELIAKGKVPHVSIQY